MWPEVPAAALGAAALDAAALGAAAHGYGALGLAAGRGCGLRLCVRPAAAAPQPA